eukprot:Lankesteria_metandrocarpae@DN4736_c0_g1_i2.p1
MNVEISLNKLVKGQTWSALHGTTQAIHLERYPVHTVGATVATQSGTDLQKTKTKDWDKLCQEELSSETTQDADGGDPLTALLQKVYADGDDNQRKAMIKSMQTSAGTVLSTNWEDVKKEDYEKNVIPAAGQEVRKWDV